MKELVRLDLKRRLQGTHCSKHEISAAHFQNRVPSLFCLDLISSPRVSCFHGQRSLRRGEFRAQTSCALWPMLWKDTRWGTPLSVGSSPSPGPYLLWGWGRVVFYWAWPWRRIREGPDPKKVLTVAQMWPIWINPSVGLVCGQCSNHCWRVTHTSLGPSQLPQPLQGGLG